MTKYLSVRAQDKIIDHLKRFLLNDPLVLHEEVSECFHLDLLKFPPTPEHPFITVASMGFSSIKMKKPKDGFSPYAEYIMFFPPDWDVSFDNEKFAWPLQCLAKYLKGIHLDKSYISYGHTFSDSDPALPYNEHTEMAACVTAFPELLDVEVLKLKAGFLREITFFCMMPVTAKEFDYIYKNGAEAFFEKTGEENADYLIVEPYRTKQIV